MSTNISIIGGGNMGEAILKGIRRKFSVSVCELNSKRCRVLKTKYKVLAGNLKDVVKSAQVVILAVKPQNINEVLIPLSEVIESRQLVISIAAGMTSNYIQKRLGAKIKVVRTMPNMPAQIGEGITAVSKGRYATAADVRLACRILNCVGETIVVKERQIDAITAVSGSGPAYVFLFVECLIQAARKLGLKESQAKALVYQTLMGSARLLTRQSDDAATLRAKVTSKGGTTQAAMDVFARRKIDKIIEEALRAAKRRAKELERENR
jgi:pyrroline-5-carboxylate reductase